MTDELEGTAEFNRAHRTATARMFEDYGLKQGAEALEGASPLLPPPPPVSEQLAALERALKHARNVGYSDGYADCLFDVGGTS